MYRLPCVVSNHYATAPSCIIAWAFLKGDSNLGESKTLAAQRGSIRDGNRSVNQVSPCSAPTRASFQLLPPIAFHTRRGQDWAGIWHGGC